MTSVDADLGAMAPPRKKKPKRLHPWPIRIMHWINAFTIIVLVGSGWGIYNDSVIFHGFSFPKSITLGGWAAESLLWHFAAMWLLIVNGGVYLIYGFVTGRFREKLLPIRVSELISTVVDTLRFKVAHDDITKYNAVQKLLYIVVILAGILQVVTGLAIWKPVQFSWLFYVLGDFQTARLIHFLGMAIIVGFLVLHIALAFLVPRTLLAMFTGGPRVARRKDTTS